MARSVSSTPSWTAWNWWYPAIFLIIFPLPSSSNTMKSLRIFRKLLCSQMPSSITWSSGRLAAPGSWSSMVFQGLNHSFPAVRVPTLAWRPSETISISFIENRVGSSALYVWS